MSSIDELLQELHFLGYQAEYNWKTKQLRVQNGALYISFQVEPHILSGVVTDELHFERVLEHVLNYFMKGRKTVHEFVS